MHASLNVIRAAELRRQDLLAEAARERQIESALPAQTVRLIAPAPGSPMTTLKIAARSTRYLLTSLASVAFAFTMN